MLQLTVFKQIDRDRNDVINEVTENKKQYIELLLLADEQEDMTDRYLEKGRMFSLDGNSVLEIRNIAAVSEYRKRGYGRTLIDFVADEFKHEFQY